MDADQPVRSPERREGTDLRDSRRGPRREEDRRLQALQREFEAARRISEALFESQDSDEVVARALETAVDVVGAEGGSILVVEPASGDLVFRHSIGTKPVPVGTAMPGDRGIAGMVFTSGEPVIIDDVARESRHFKQIDQITSFMTRDLIAAPLQRWNGGRVGVIEVLNKRCGRFDRNDLALLSIVSAIAASAIERARLNEEAKLAEVVKLFGDISHDIKNLLTPLVCSAELLPQVLERLFARLDTGRQEELARSYEKCQRVITSVGVASRRTQDRLKAFCDCLKGMSTEPRFAPCRVDGIVGEVFEALRPPAQQHGVNLVASGLEALPAIVADEGRLFNAFYNLVNNALAAMPSGGTITCSGEPEPGAAGLSVAIADTGRGMSPEQCATLLAGEAVSKKRLGSGLGVRIVKDVVDAHRGRVTVESAVGAGTTFRIFLPLDPAAAPA